MTGLFNRSSATLSDCGAYRYWLERRWNTAAPLTFVMLNPSTADADQDDPTIRRCVSFAKREGAGGIIVVNLFGLRSTDPSALKGHPDPVGPDNMENVGLAMLHTTALKKHPIICAWGAHDFAKDQANTVRRRAADMELTLHCLGTTKSGAPRHPLYVKGDKPFEVWGAQ